MGINADISTYSPPSINPTYFDLNLHVEFKKTEKLLRSYGYSIPNSKKLNDDPASSEAIVSLLMVILFSL